MYCAICVGVAFIPSFVIWMIVLFYRKLIPDYSALCDSSYTRKAGIEESCERSQYEDRVVNNLFFMCKGMCLSLQSYSEGMEGMAAVGVFYFVCAGFLLKAFRISYSLVSVGAFAAAPILAYTIHHIIYRKESLHDRLSKFDPGEISIGSDPLRYYEEYFRYLKKCAKYFKARKEAMYFCFIIGSAHIIGLLCLFVYIGGTV